MQSSRIGVFEMRGIARTYSNQELTPIPFVLTVCSLCSEIDYGLGTAQGVLSQFDPTPSVKVTIVTKGGQRINAAPSVRYCAE
jgi:hypothetical protein